MHGEWEPAEFSCNEYKGTHILSGEAVELLQGLLDDHVIKTQTMKGSPYAKEFLTTIMDWEIKLLRTQENLEKWLKVQSVWLYLEPVFSSDDIMKQMQVEGTRFREVDRMWRGMMAKVADNPRALDVIEIDDMGQILMECDEKLEQVQKGLNQYLEGKRGLFPRFYFLSNDELLEILSETKEPLRVQPHLKKCFEGIHELEFDEEKKIHAMYSPEGEQVSFTQVIDTLAHRENVENWLLLVQDTMACSVRDAIEKSLQDCVKKKRDKWVLDWPGQAVLNGSMTYWTTNTEEALKSSGMTGLQAYFEKV